MSARALSGRARVAGVIGWPVAHSLSPRLHGFWLDRYGIDGAYVPLPVRPSAIERAIRSLADLGFVGANVTLPHKEAALGCADEVSARARRIGAVNTLIVRPDGTLHADNTDGYGFLENLRSGWPDWRPSLGPAMLLGAGGSARAVCVALLDAGVPEVRLTNRTPDRALALALATGGPVTVIPWDARTEALAGCALLVNATSLGMTGQDALQLDLGPLPATAVVTDLVYAPLKTALLLAAERRGNPIVDGLGMLLHQARPGFAAWFGVEPTVTAELRAFVLRA